MLQTPTRTSAALIAEAEKLIPWLREQSAAIEAERRLTPEVHAAMVDAGFYRITMPEPFSSVEDCTLSEAMRILETLARGDASTAWSVWAALGTPAMSAFLSEEGEREMFGSREASVVNSIAAMGRAVAVDGGYRVTGTWSFASGCRHATWLGAHCPIFEADGTPRRDTDGHQAERTFLVPAGEVTWTDIWSVIGLRGTASDAFSLNEHFVRHDHSITRDFQRECREPGPLYRLSAMAMYELAFSGVALGIARAVLDTFIDMSRNKIPRGKRSPIRDNAVVQTQCAQAEVRVRSARLYLLHVYNEIWEAVQAPGSRFTLDQRITVRMASTHAIHQARDAVDFAYNAAGASAIFETHPMERRFRDVHTVTQQLQGRLSHFESVGAYILGADPDLTFV